jgi:hypothetical protein
MASTIMLSTLTVPEYRLNQLELKSLDDLQNINFNQIYNLTNLQQLIVPLGELYAIDDTQDIVEILSQMTDWNIDHINTIVKLDISGINND